ncbi:GRAS transcription factor [Rhynchospora pubera]|uniref:GRAS transcription factor n=1 Tax=Rhynchospora pubera TaxID=906938 RepID=A0AAV8GPQ9_9POAL|nr:GRAS transcription factor [Rhynchospora pubera]
MKTFIKERLLFEILRNPFYDILKNEYPFSPTTKSSNITDSGSHTTEIVLKNDMQSYGKSKPPFINAGPASALSIENLPTTQIQKGAEEAMKFLPAIGKLFIGLEPNGIEIDEEEKSCYISENKAICHASHTKKCVLNDRGSDLSEGQAHKQRAVFSDEPTRNEHLEQFLLFRDQEYVKEVISVRKTVKKEIKNNSWEHQDKNSENEIRKKETEKGCVDLQSLLIRCSEAVSTNDNKQACELISEIRKHSSPRGDCYQRLAHYLVDALEARLAGTGSDIYHELLSRQGNISDTLKAARIYHAICPFLRAWYYFSNQTIFNVSKGATKVHIIDFGIQMGFMWPSFFERLSSLGSAAPNIRITGIGFPEKGFRPGKLIEATGRRLSEYAQRFNINFKYQGMASKWENITIEDLKIDKDEVLVVNCLHGLKNVLDESIGRDNPRDKVLRLIKEIKPCVFIHGILNGSYGTPFFTTRFKEVLSKFFSFFDIYEATIPRGSEMRIHIENNILIPSAINAIA